MGYTEYVSESIQQVTTIYTSLTSKKPTLSVHDFKTLLNDYYLKHFGFDRRTGKMMTTDYATSSFCSSEQFHVDKCLLLACFLMEDVKLTEKKETQRVLLNKILFLYRTFSLHFPDIKFAPLEKELKAFT